MSLRNYCVLKGDPSGGAVQFDHNGQNPHYLIRLEANGSEFQVAVNIESRDGSEVLYRITPGFTPPDAPALQMLPPGLTNLPSSSGGLALDYVRETIAGTPMVTRAEMALLPVSAPAGDAGNALQNAVVDLLNQAVADPNGAIYAFGQSFADSGTPDGIHNIHMNQGNPGSRFASENGIWQDGALFINLPQSDAWTALFLAFQTESWQTDEHGNPVPA
jgi:uncharacterized protein YukJ